MPSEAIQRDAWLVTGAAGFIGSHIVETLLARGCTVRGIDDLSTGDRANVMEAVANAGAGAAERFTFIEGDILDRELLLDAARGVRFVSHQAAVASVPESIQDPARTARVNVEGFTAVARAAGEAGAQRVVYASSSAIYGDDPAMPKTETMTGNLLSPYAASKRADELFAEAMGSCTDVEFIGLRYFNVFGPRQNPGGPYAAVIPLWIGTLLEGGRVTINGDPQITRDFVYVDNAVEANIKAAYAGAGVVNDVYNIANGKTTTLRELLSMIVEALRDVGVSGVEAEPVIGPQREGDIKHSQADIAKAAAKLGYRISVDIDEGLRRTVAWAAGARKET